MEGTTIASFEATQAIAAYQSGDKDAGNALAEHIRAISARRLRRQVSTSHEVDELAQECAVCVLARLGEYSPSLGSFEGWISGFAHNVWRSHLRATSRRRLSTIPMEEIAETVYEVETAVNTRENLGAAIDSLELVDQELLHMRYSLGMSSEEIAEASAMNPPQVRKRISRAVERLRKHPATQALLMSLTFG